MHLDNVLRWHGVADAIAVRIPLDFGGLELDHRLISSIRRRMTQVMEPVNPGFLPHARRTRLQPLFLYGVQVTRMGRMEERFGELRLTEGTMAHRPSRVVRVLRSPIVEDRGGVVLVVLPLETLRHHTLAIAVLVLNDVERALAL